MLNCSSSGALFYQKLAPAPELINTTAPAPAPLLQKLRFKDEGSIRTPPAEALMWVSIFAWVTTLIVFLYAAYGQKFYNAWGEFYYSLIISILYIVVTVVWAVYMVSFNADFIIAVFMITLQYSGYCAFVLFRRSQLL